VEEEQEEEERKRWEGREYEYNIVEEHQTKNTIRESKKENKIEKFWRAVIIKKREEKRMITK
jgi:hypothetical protein